MKPEREPSTILFFGNMTLSRTEVLRDHPFVWRILIGYALVRGSLFVSQARKRLGKPWGKPWGKLRGTSCEKFRRFGCVKIGVKSPKCSAKFSRHFSRRVSNQVSQRLSQGVPPTSGQHGRQSVLYDNFLRIPSQNGCCGPSARFLPSIHSQGTQVSCVRGGHLQNGKPVRRQNPKKMGKKWKMAPGLKWPKNGRRNEKK